jgi:hypothetical protein
MTKRLIVVVVFTVAVTLAGCSSGTTNSATTTTPAASSTTVGTSGSGQTASGATLSIAPPPWSIPADATPYIAAAGLRAQSGETLRYHYHAHLDIMDSTQSVVVPAGIGFVIQNGQEVALTSLHTHDTTGIIHIESATNTPYTLGQVFTEWGVRLTATQAGGLIAGNGNAIHVAVDGSTFAGDPATIVLRPHQEIAIWYGPQAVTPHLPSSYSFPQGD